MATRARLRTAYDAGYQAEDGPPPDYIAGDSELLDAWDKGFDDRQSGRRSTGPDEHRPDPRPRRTSTSRAPKPKPTPAPVPQGGDPVDEQLPPAQPSSTSSPRQQSHPVRDAGRAMRKMTLSPATDNLGGFVLGMVVYLAAVQYIRGGAGAPLRWFRAKFENKVTGGVSASDAAQMATLNNLLAGPGTATQGGTFATGPGGSTPASPAAPGGSPGVLDPIGIILGGDAAPKLAPPVSSGLRATVR